MSYNAIACCFPTGVIIDDCPTRPTSSLLCTLRHSKGVFQYNDRFVITLISLGSQNERYNEVAAQYLVSFVLGNGVAQLEPSQLQILFQRLHPEFEGPRSTAAGVRLSLQSLHLPMTFSH